MSGLRDSGVLFLVAWLSVGSNSAHGYELVTHEQVTERAFAASQGIATYLSEVGIQAGDEFLAEKPTDPKQLAEFKNTGTPQHWMMEGSIREDDFAPTPELLGCPEPKNPQPAGNRLLNHFFDVQRGGKGLNVPVLFGLFSSELGAPAPDWALGLRGRGPDVDQNQYSILDARENQLVSLVAESRADRDKFTARLFRSLGQIIHLVQDMAQPQHVRNDRHAGCKPLGSESFGKAVTGEESFYEKYIDTRAKGIRFKNRSQPSAPLPFSPYRPPRLSTYRDFWTTPGGKGLADFTSRNFLSAGTNLPDRCRGLPEPPCSTDQYFARLKSFTIEHLQGTASGVVILYDRPIQDRNSGEVLLDVAVTSASFWDQHLEARGKELAFSMNSLVYDEIIQPLLPRAVGYSAGFLDYFFRGRLTAFAPPNTAGQVRVRNLSAGALQGDIVLLWEDDQGVRTPVGPAQPIALAPRCPPDQPACGDTSGPLPFTPKPEAKGRYVAAFQGTLGLEEGAVIGRVLRPRLAFTGVTCAEIDQQDPTKCNLSLFSLYRWDAGPPSEPARITALTQRQGTEDFADSRPAWAPDGSQLAFTSNKGTGTQFMLWLMDADGTNRRQALGKASDTAPLQPIRIDGRPAWAPDGTRLAFARITNQPLADAGQGGRDLFLYELTNGRLTRLTQGNPTGQAFDFLEPAWTPDGSRLAAVAAVGGLPAPFRARCQSNLRSLELVLLTVAGGLDRWLTCTPGADLAGQVVSAEPALTLDGQVVVFSQLSADTQETDLWEVRLDATPDATTGAIPQRRLTQTSVPQEQSPSLAPDQATLAFASNLTGPFHLYTLTRPQDPSSGPVAYGEDNCLTCKNTVGILEAVNPAWSPGLP